ncbi:MAG: SRPBCC family protein [Bradymonadaceae bacterium]
MAQNRSEMMKKEQGGLMNTENLNTPQIASMLGGGAMMAYGLAKRGVRGMIMAAAGGGLLFLGMRQSGMGQGMSRRMSKGRKIEIEETIIVDRPIEDVFEFWSNFENFPRFMKHIESVERRGDRGSHWAAAVPVMDATLDWDAEMTEIRDNEIISWRSIKDADIYNEGTVRFRQLPDGQRTEVTARICYQPPAGVLGTVAAKFLNVIPRSFVKNDMESFKEIVESEEGIGMTGEDLHL